MNVSSLATALPDWLLLVAVLVLFGSVANLVVTVSLATRGRGRAPSPSAAAVDALQPILGAVWVPVLLVAVTWLRLGLFVHLGARTSKRSSAENTSTRGVTVTRVAPLVGVGTYWYRAALVVGRRNDAAGQREPAVRTNRFLVLGHDRFGLTIGRSGIARRFPETDRDG